MNILVTDMNNRARRRYVSAGYAAHDQQGSAGQQEEMYIARIPAGSAQDDLRDLNRKGYQTGARTPDPFFADAPGDKQTSSKTPAARRRHRRGLMEAAIDEGMRDPKGALLCLALVIAIITLVVAWCSMLVERVQVEQSVQKYYSEAAKLEKEIETLSQRLEQEKDGERIRTIARNELGMERRERADTVKIYVQIPEKARQTQTEAQPEQHMQPLDFLLGLLSVFGR